MDDKPQKRADLDVKCSKTIFAFEQLIVALKVEDPAAFQNFVIFEPAMFQELVNRLTPLITKTDTNCLKALDPGLKLAITLRYLATGDSILRFTV